MIELPVPGYVTEKCVKCGGPKTHPEHANFGQRCEVCWSDDQYHSIKYAAPDIDIWRVVTGK